MGHDFSLCETQLVKPGTVLEKGAFLFYKLRSFHVQPRAVSGSAVVQKKNFLSPSVTTAKSVKHRPARESYSSLHHATPRCYPQQKGINLSIHFTPFTIPYDNVDPVLASLPSGSFHNATLFVFLVKQQRFTMLSTRLTTTILPNELYPVVTDIESGSSFGLPKGRLCTIPSGTLSREGIVRQSPTAALEMQSSAPARSGIPKGSGSTSIRTGQSGSRQVTYFVHDQLFSDMVARSFDDSFVLTRQVRVCVYQLIPRETFLDIRSRSARGIQLTSLHIQVCSRNVSTIWECVHRETGDRYCVKMTDKRRFSSRADGLATRREMAVLTSLQRLQCRQVPRLVHVSEDRNKCYVAMEYVPGGNLSTALYEQHHFDELRVKGMVRSLLSAMGEMHRVSHGHFNLSPGNILLRSTGLDEVVVCDFGCALDLRSVSASSAGNPKSEYSMVRSALDHGALFYTAPELLKKDKSYELAADLWSVGVIVYQLLCGRLPFEDVSRRALKNKIALGKFQFTGSEWHSVSRTAKQFISSLLHPDPQVRLTIDEALDHPWLMMQKAVVVVESSPVIPDPSRKVKRGNKLRGLFGRPREDYSSSSVIRKPREGSWIPTREQRSNQRCKPSDISTASTMTGSDSSAVVDSSLTIPVQIR